MRFMSLQPFRRLAQLTVEPIFLVGIQPLASNALTRDAAQDFCSVVIWQYGFETQSHCKQNTPFLRPSQTEGHPGLCAQRRKGGSPAMYRVSFEPVAFACA